VRQPPHEADTQVPCSQRWSLAHTPQNCFAGPQASMPLFGAQEPSGRQHELVQMHVGGPASTPASLTGAASQSPATHSSLERQERHAAPPTPQSSRAVPPTHSWVSVQQPSQFSGLHSR